MQLQSAQRRIERGQSNEFTFDKLDSIFSKYKKQNDRLVRLVNDMLDISKMNLGKLSYEFKRSDLKAIMETSFENIQEQFEDKKSSLKIIGENNSVFGSFDKQRLEQVLTNLLTNALKYGEGKPVTISMSVKDKKAQVRVKDLGLGIPVENFDKIFQKFERVPASLDISGLGIGLFIAKEIVEAHHGKIWVESTEGQGSTFIVELPVE